MNLNITLPLIITVTIGDDENERAITCDAIKEKIFITPVQD